MCYFESGRIKADRRNASIQNSLGMRRSSSNKDAKSTNNRSGAREKSEESQIPFDDKSGRSLSRGWA